MNINHIAATIAKQKYPTTREQTSKITPHRTKQKQKKIPNSPTSYKQKSRRRKKKKGEQRRSQPASWTWLPLAEPPAAPFSSAPDAAAATPAGRKHAPRSPRATAAQHPHPRSSLRREGISSCRPKIGAKNKQRTASCCC